MSRAPTKGHKFGGIRYMAQAKCECGWEGTSFIGTGARRQAYSEWHNHVDRHERAVAGELPCACYGFKRASDGAYVHARGCKEGGT